jgi:hypothetical protein
MISLNLHAVQVKQAESEKIAAAMAEFWSAPGRSYTIVPPGKPIPRPERRDWVDPETVLKRKSRIISPAGRKQIRQMTEAL